MRSFKECSPMGVAIALRLAVLAVLAHYCASMQGARERCMINFLDGCKAHKTYMGIADDSAAAYDYMGVGQSEERCLARAKEYFEWCSNELHQQVVREPPHPTGSAPRALGVSTSHSTDACV